MPFVRQTGVLRRLYLQYPEVYANKGVNWHIKLIAKGQLDDYGHQIALLKISQHGHLLYCINSIIGVTE
jgi:hypothetical protein